MVNFIKRYYGFSLFFLVIVIHWMANLISPMAFHHIYSRLFTVLRTIYDNTMGHLPFASFYLLLLGATFAFYKLIKRVLVYRENNSLRASVALSLKRIANTILLFFGLFYVVWGYNYHRNGILETQQWPEVNVDSTLLIKELFAVTQRLNEYQKEDSTLSKKILPWTNIEDKIRQSQTKLLEGWKYTTPGKVRIRPLYPKGSLLRISTAGFYNPFSFEGHVDPGLNQLQWPFTIAHEMAHGYGFTDEGECNFIGLVSCITSPDKYLQYSGWISYWRYLFYDVKDRYPDQAEKCYTSLHQNVVNDLKDIRKDSQKYPDIFPWARDFIYDFYLKLHGMEDGLESYNGISGLMLSYQNHKNLIQK